VIKKGDYRIEPNMMLEHTWNLWHLDRPLATGLEEIEAQSVLAEIIERKHQKMTEISLDIETQEGIIQTKEFAPRKKDEARAKIKELQDAYAAIKKEIGSQ
jgi:hypothetical protein